MKNVVLIAICALNFTVVGNAFANVSRADASEQELASVTYQWRDGFCYAVDATGELATIPVQPSAVDTLCGSTNGKNNYRLYELSELGCNPTIQHCR